MKEHNSDTMKPSSNAKPERTTGAGQDSHGSQKQAPTHVEQCDMDVVEDPFSLVAFTKSSKEFAQFFAFNKISSLNLTDTHLLAQTYAVNIVTSFLSEKETLTITNTITLTNSCLTEYTLTYVCLP